LSATTLLLEAAFLVRLKLIAVRNAVAVEIFGILEDGKKCTTRPATRPRLRFPSQWRFVYEPVDCFEIRNDV
jgi:hypothetical protein